MNSDVLGIHLFQNVDFIAAQVAILSIFLLEGDGFTIKRTVERKKIGK